MSIVGPVVAFAVVGVGGVISPEVSSSCCCSIFTVGLYFFVGEVDDSCVPLRCLRGSDGLVGDSPAFDLAFAVVLDFSDWELDGFLESVLSDFELLLLWLRVTTMIIGSSLPGRCRFS